MIETDEANEAEAPPTDAVGPPPESLVRSIEVWRLEGDRLVCRAAAARDASADVGDRPSYAVGEGVLGRAWAGGVPAIEGDATAAAVAIPAMAGGECRGVLRLGCAAADERRGAFEVWRRNDRGELALDANWYANLDRLERISQHIKFPRRAGLPGKVWEHRFPRVLGAVQNSKDFIRVAAARADQLNAALGVPFMVKPPELDAVLLLLSTNASPIARAMEVWAQDPESGLLRIVSADYGPYVDLAPLSRRLTLRRNEGIAGRVYNDRAPFLTTDLLGAEFPRGERFQEYGINWGVGLPVFVGADLVACVNMYL